MAGFILQTMAGNITIVEPTENFQKVSKDIILNQDVDALTLGIYVKLLTLGKKWQLNVNGLASALHISTDKIRKTFALLEKFGYLKRSRVQGEHGHFTGWDYIISSAPFTDIAILPTSVNTDIGKNQPSENTDIGKKAMYNNRPIKETKDIKGKQIDNIPPTPQDVIAYAKERGFVDAEGFAAHWFAYYTQANWHLANGKPMKDWKKAVITWEPNNKDRRFTPTPTPSPAPGKGGSKENSLDYDFTQFYK